MSKNDKETNETAAAVLAELKTAKAPVGSRPKDDEAQEVIAEPNFTPSKELPQKKRFAREIAYGIQQTIMCWATDFIDPPISKWYQNRFGNKNHEVTMVHVAGGEVIGDSVAAVAYIAAKRLLTAPIDAFTSASRKVLDPIYDRMGKKTLKAWRKSNDMEKDDPRYVKKLEDYKQFQAENTIDTGIIAVSATGVNVLAQRALGNKQSYLTILNSKVTGATLTVLAMLGLRALIPQTTKQLDDELSDRYVSHVVKFAQRKAGVEEENTTAVPETTPATISHAERLAQKQSEQDPSQVVARY